MRAQYGHLLGGLYTHLDCSVGRRVAWEGLLPLETMGYPGYYFFPYAKITAAVYL